MKFISIEFKESEEIPRGELAIFPLTELISLIFREVGDYIIIKFKSQNIAGFSKEFIKEEFYSFLKQNGHKIFKIFIRE